MQYFVIWPDGQKFGPADAAKLNEWIAENRINQDTELESVIDGSRLKAKDVPGLSFPIQSIQTPADDPTSQESFAQPQEPTFTQSPITQPDPTPSQTSSQPSQPGTSQEKSYYVTGSGGQKYGPANIPTLTQWASENRLTPTTELEDAATGEKVLASQVSGIIFPMGTASAAATQNPITPTSPYGSTSQSGSTEQSQSPYAQYPRQDSFDDEQQRKNATISIVLSVVGICCCCVLNIVGLVMAYKVKESGHPMGKTAVLVGWICLAIMLVINSITAFIQFSALNSGGGMSGF